MMEVSGYNIAWWTHTSITCTLYSALFVAAIILHAIPIGTALCSMILYLFMYAVREAPYWLVSNAFKTVCDALPNQGPKRRFNRRSDDKFKRKRNAGGEKTALYF